MKNIYLLTFFNLIFKSIITLYLKENQISHYTSLFTLYK